MNESVVMLIEKEERGKIGREDKIKKGWGIVLKMRKIDGRKRRMIERINKREIILRRLVEKIIDRKIGEILKMMDEEEKKIVSGIEENREIKEKFEEDRMRLWLILRIKKNENEIMDLRKNNLIGGNVILEKGKMVENELDEEIEIGKNIERREGEEGRENVMNGDERKGRNELKEGLKKEFLGERIEKMKGGEILIDRIVELRRWNCWEEKKIEDSIWKKIEERKEEEIGLRKENEIMKGKKGRKGIEEDIEVIEIVEIKIEKESRKEEGIEIEEEEGKKEREEVEGFWMVGLEKEKRINWRKGERENGEKVEKD